MDVLTCKVPSLSSDKLSIQIQLETLSELSEWILKGKHRNLKI